MLKPVSILALDNVAAPLARAVQQRVATFPGADDLVQVRELAAADLAQSIQSIHAQRQRPDSPLRLRDDVSARELVLVMFSAAGPARSSVIDTARQIRALYETRRLASFFTIELLCLLPEVAGTASPDDYAAAYGLLRTLASDEPKPFEEVWLLDATNGRRVTFGSVELSLATYADAIAGVLTHEPEMSGALPGIHPRGMRPAFSSFGYASLVFPRDEALQRLEPRFAAELIRTRLLDGSATLHAQLQAKQFVAAEAFALPLSRIGIDAGQSLFRRFQPKTAITEQTRSAEENIAAVRNELQVFRDSVYLEKLEAVAKQGEQTTRELDALLSRTIDETLDRDGYEAAERLLDALLDPLPELRVDAELAPRNVVTEIRTATAALDARLRFSANTAASDGARKRVRELETLIQDQRLVADTVGPASAESEIAELEREKESLLREIPEMLFAEERENNVARTAAREAEAARLASETEAREQELRELFAQVPRAEHALREALETRRVWLWQQLAIAIVGVAVIYAFPRIAITALVLFAIVTAIRYVTKIAPLVKIAREQLAKLRAQILLTDQARIAAHNAELQFEYDISHRRTTLRVLRAIHDSAKGTLESLRVRRQELIALATSFVPASIRPEGLHLPIVDDAELDHYYERTIDDRKPFVREFPISRSASRTLALEALRERVSSHARAAFSAFRELTLATAAATLTSDAKLAQRLKRLADTSAPLAEVRDDDLPANGAMQRDCTLWVDPGDAKWIAQLQHRFPEAHVKAAADVLSVHVVSRVLHYPGYVLGQIEYYRAQYEAAGSAESADVEDLVPPEILLGAPVRAAYEQILLARALGVALPAALGDTNLAAAQRLAAPQSEAMREQIDVALNIKRDISGELRSLRETMRTPLDRNVLDGLLRKYM